MLRLPFRAEGYAVYTVMPLLQTPVMAIREPSMSTVIDVHADGLAVFGLPGQFRLSGCRLNRASPRSTTL